MMRVRPFSQSSENPMLSAIAARIGTDPARRTVGIDTQTVSGPPNEPDTLRFLSSDGRLHLPLRLADKRQANLRQKRLQNATTSDNPIEQNKSPRASRSLQDICGQFNRSGAVATNGQSVIPPPSALPKVQRSTRSHNLLPKRSPSGHPEIAGQVARRGVGRRTSLGESVDHLAYPARSTKLLDRESNLKKSMMKASSGRSAI
jgi:hypothetical protein